MQKKLYRLSVYGLHNNSNSNNLITSPQGFTYVRYKGPPLLTQDNTR